jgi:hypothetical protein
MTENMNPDYIEEREIVTKQTYDRKQLKLPHHGIGIIIGVVLIFLMSGSSMAQNRASVVKEKRNPFKLVLYYNNLLGIGLGGHLKLLNPLSTELLLGTESPVNIIWTIPYEGNIINIHARVNLHLPMGFHLSAGWYAGYFDITRDIDVDSQVTLWQTAPTLSMGIKLPFSFRKSTWYFELGSAFNLPTRIYRIFNTELEIYSLEVERSASSMGSVFPFVSLQVHI